jgi:hypothetical protein
MLPPPATTPAQPTDTSCVYMGHFKGEKEDSPARKALVALSKALATAKSPDREKLIDALTKRMEDADMDWLLARLLAFIHYNGGFKVATWEKLTGKHFILSLK